MKKLVILFALSFLLLSFVSAVNNDSLGLNAKSCLKEGETFSIHPDSMKCCDGLNYVPCDKVDEKGKCEYGCTGASYCANCGDGECKLKENKCNCPEDCGGAICGNGECEDGEASMKQWLTCSSEDQTYCSYNQCDKDCGEGIEESETEDVNPKDIQKRVENEVRKRLTNEQTKKLIQVKNRLMSDIQNRECPERCTCIGSATKCEFANGTREMTIIAGNSGNTIIQVKGVNASTQVTLYKSEDGRIFAVKENNETKEIRMLPDQVREKIKNKINAKLENENITLNEDGTYNYIAEKKAKLWGLFALKVAVKARINAETGEVVEVNKPKWWEFMVKPEKDEMIVGESCGTVTPGSNDECCQNKGYDLWNTETSDCEFSKTE